MSQALLAHVANSSVKKDVPSLKSGYVVRVHQRIVEGEKERTQIFEGLVIKMSSGFNAADKTFTVRKIVEGVGVEKVFPVYSTMIEKIEVIKTGKVRRSKLYYMRGLQGKSARLQDKHGEAIEMMLAPVKSEKVVEEEEVPAPVEEAPVEEVKEAPEVETPVEETPVEETPSEPEETPVEEEAKEEKQD